MSDDPLHALVAYIAAKPLRAPQFMARTLKRPLVALERDIEIAERKGWLEGEEGCCGAGWRYRVTDAGRAIARQSGA